MYLRKLTLTFARIFAKNTRINIIIGYTNRIKHFNQIVNVFKNECGCMSDVCNGECMVCN